MKEQLHKLEVQATDKVPRRGSVVKGPRHWLTVSSHIYLPLLQDENKDIALGTSKLNYLDPRISVAWCKKHEVPIEKVYNKTQRQKFMWAIDMAGPEFRFIE